MGGGVVGRDRPVRADSREPNRPRPSDEGHLHPADEEGACASVCLPVDAPPFHASFILPTKRMDESASARRVLPPPKRPGGAFRPPFLKASTRRAAMRGAGCEPPSPPRLVLAAGWLLRLCTERARSLEVISSKPSSSMFAQVSPVPWPRLLKKDPSGAVEDESDPAADGGGCFACGIGESACFSSEG